MKTSTFLFASLLLMNAAAVFLQIEEGEKNQVRLKTGKACTGSGDIEGYWFSKPPSNSAF
jgi:hypothetical protein